MMEANGGAGPGAQPWWWWDVALSFAGAQRDYVEQVARALQARRARCFCDADAQIDLWVRYQGAGNNRAIRTVTASNFLNGPGVRCGTGGRQRGRNGLPV